jgi:hypothetical protein
MAKKRTTTTKKRNRSLSSGGKKRKGSKRKRHPKGVLAEIGLADNSPPTWGQSFKKTIGAGSGGGLAIVAHKLTPATVPKIARVGGSFILGLVAARFGMPSTGAGFFGGTIALNFQNGLMGEDANYANNNALSDMPIYLDEQGQPMVLEEGQDGTSGYRYLSDEEVAELTESGAFSEYEVVN